MAKKSSKNAAPAKDSRPADGEKVAFQVRFDSDLHARLVQLAEESGISLNQLVQGMCRGTLAAAHAGEWNEYAFLQGDKPYPFVRSKPAKGCVWFGKEGEFDEHMGEPVHSGTFWFGIDVRERGDVHFASSPPT